MSNRYNKEVKNTQHIELPLVFQYLNYREFLKDYTKVLKKTKGFRLSEFAKSAGIKSPGYLKMIIDGERKLSVQTAQKFANALQLEDKEAQYFETLVVYNQETDPDIKAKYFDRLIALRPRSQEFELEKSQNKYYSRHYYVAIREMVVLEDFKEDYKWIAKRCFPQISPAQAKEAIQTLLELNLLTRDKNNTLIQTQDFIQTTDRNNQIAETYQYHDAVLNKARKALALLKQNERSYYGLTIPLSHKLYKEIVNEFYEFMDGVTKKIEQDTNPMDEVYQLNFQVFPVTKKKGQDDK